MKRKVKKKIDERKILTDKEMVKIIRLSEKGKKIPMEEAFKIVDSL